VVRNRARIVMVGPELGVVLEERDIVDLVLSLDIAVFRDAQIDAGARLVEAVPRQTAVRQGLARTMDADAAGPRADADILFLLVLERIKMADARRLGSHVTHLDQLHAGDPGQQILPE